MNSNKEKILYRELSYKIVGLAMEVHSKLGYGITDAHRAQTLNYLKATGLRLAILINFGKESLQHERFVH